MSIETSTVERQVYEVSENLEEHPVTEVLGNPEIPSGVEIDATLESLKVEIDAIFTPEVLREMPRSDGKDTQPGDCNDEDNHVAW